MATFAVAQSPSRSGSPTSPDRHSKDIPPPLSLTVETPAATSPFPSPSSSFLPPPMPGAHEYANKQLSARFLRKKKSNNASGVEVVPDSPTASKEEGQSNGGSKQPNGIVPTADTHSVGAAVTPGTPTLASLALTPTANSPNIENGPFNITDAWAHDNDLTTTASAPPSAESGEACGRNTPTQMHITLPPPPLSPTQVFSNAAAVMRTPSGSGTASKHTSLSSSRPAPASPSPIPSRRQSGVPSIRSRHRSGISTTSNSSSSKFGTIKSPPPLPQVPRRKGEIRVQDFAFPSEDLRHKGCGPDAPKVIKKLLKHHGPLDAASRRESGMSESSVDSEASSRRSSGFGSWSAFRWASRLSGAWRLGSGSNGNGNGSGSRSSGAGGYTPNQQDFERNFDGTADVDVVDSPAEDDEYSSDYEDEVEAEPEELLPGLYRALYDFDPEGTAEMGLKEGQTVRVVGRGGGVGWAIAVRGDTDADADEGEGENNWALVPESYLRVVKLDEPGTEDEVGRPPSLDDGDQS